VLKRGDHTLTTQLFTVAIPRELFSRWQALQGQGRRGHLNLGGGLAAALEDAANDIGRLLKEAGPHSEVPEALRGRRFAPVIFPPAGAAEGRRGLKRRFGGWALGGKQMAMELAVWTDIYEFTAR
jgi:hypothetical protein